MVLLGGLEIVAAGYLIHKHQQNKKDKARLEEEAAALEEEQYRIFPPEDRKHRRPRSASRGRHSHEHHRSHDRYERRHSYDRESRKSRRENTMPLSPQMRPQQYPNPSISTASLATQAMRPQAPSMGPPPQYDPSTAPARPAQDVKYGWTDEPAQQPRPQDPNFPPTGWPAHWEQSQTPPVNNLQPPSQQANTGRSRRERTPESSPHVRFAVPNSSSQRPSPPPSYKP